MAAKQTVMLMGRLVEHQEHFNPLSTADAQWAIQNPKDAAALCVTAIKSRTNGAPKTERSYKILRPVAPKPVGTRPFKADDSFFNKKSIVKMVPHGSNFTAWFTGKVEKEAPEGMLVPFVLTQSAYDSEIIADLGGEEKAEITLGEIWRLMQRQTNGKKGVLLVNGWANIFYVRDVNGVLRAVVVRWCGCGWGAGAFDLGGRTWSVVYQVFSRNS
ncbi:MAG: hypothetical protein HYW34_00210 [Candidatus Brennerbacteria bacterium]|nr:hypothetical protein [Candidatus Brennerbacteria bacterium]